MAPDFCSTVETIFIGLERRRFALPQKFVSLHSIDLEAAAAAAAANTGSLPGVVVSGACGGGRGQAKQSSIGFFYPPQLQEGKFTITRGATWFLVSSFLQKHTYMMGRTIVLSML